MKEFKWAFSALLFAVFLSSPVQAQEIIVYPAKGQSNGQVVLTASGDQVAFVVFPNRHKPNTREIDRVSEFNPNIIA